MSLRLVLVDDSEETLEVLKLMYAQHPDVEIVGVAETAIEARRLVEMGRVDAISVDIHLSGENGIHLCHAIRELYPQVFLVICTLEGDEEIERIAREAGAHLFLAKPVSADDVERMVWTAQQFRTHLIDDIDDIDDLDTRGMKATSDALTRVLPITPNSYSFPIHWVLVLDGAGKLLQVSDSLLQADPSMLQWATGRLVRELPDYVVGDVSVVSRVLRTDGPTSAVMRLPLPEQDGYLHSRRVLLECIKLRGVADEKQAFGEGEFGEATIRTVLVFTDLSRLEEDLTQLDEVRLDELVDAFDPVSGAHSSAFFDRQLRIAAQSSELSTSIVMFALDGTENLESQGNMAAVDEVLRDFVHLVRSRSRDTDTLCRLADYEFALLLLHKPTFNPGTLAQKIQGVAREADALKKHGIHVHTGCATYQRGLEDVAALRVRARDVLFRAQVGIER